jgi:hypothetical protein
MTSTIVIDEFSFNLKDMKKNPKILIVGTTKTGKTTLSKELLEEIKRKNIKGTNKIKIFTNKFVDEYNTISTILQQNEVNCYMSCETFIKENNTNDILIVDENLEKLENIYLEKDMSIINIKNYQEYNKYEEYEVNIGKYDYVFVLGKFTTYQQLENSFGLPKDILKNDQIGPIYRESMIGTYTAFMWENVKEYPVYKKYMWYAPNYEPIKEPEIVYVQHEDTKNNMEEIVIVKKEETIKTENNKEEMIKLKEENGRVYRELQELKKINAMKLNLPKLSEYIKHLLDDLVRNGDCKVTSMEGLNLYNPIDTYERMELKNGEKVAITRNAS